MSFLCLLISGNLSQSLSSGIMLLSPMELRKQDERNITSLVRLSMLPMISVALFWKAMRMRANGEKILSEYRESSRIWIHSAR